METICESCGQLVPSGAWPLELGDLKVIDEHTFYWKGQRVHLTPVERLVTLIFVRHPRALFTAGLLAEQLGDRWRDPTGTSRTWISRVRASFAAVDPDFGQLESVYGAGWRWEVRERQVEQGTA